MTEEHISRIMKILILVIVFSLVVFGISAKGLGPMRENIAGVADKVLLMFNRGGDGSSGDCRSDVRQLENGIGGTVNACEKFCSFELIDPEELLDYEEFSFDTYGYNARKIDSKNSIGIDAFGNDPVSSDLHRDIYLELKRVVEEFPDENFMELLGADLDSYFRITIDDDYAFIWDGKNWKKELKGSDLYPIVNRDEDEGIVNDDTVSGVWSEFEDYVEEKKKGGYNVEINKEDKAIRFEAKEKEFLKTRSAFFKLRKDMKIMVDPDKLGGARYPFGDVHFPPLNSEVKEFAEGLNLILDNYILSLGDSNEDVLSEIYREYTKINSNVYWNYIGDGAIRGPTFDSDINIESYSDDELRGFLNEITEEIDGKDNSSAFYVKINKFWSNPLYVYKNGNWQRGISRVGKTLEIEVVLEAILSARENDKEIILSYKKVEEEEFRKWINEKSKEFRYSKEDQKKLLLSFSKYLESATVNLRGDEFPVSIEEVYDNGFYRILIHFYDIDGERFGVYSDEEKLILVSGEKIKKSPVNEWLDLSDADWKEFLKINQINEYLVEKCRI